MPVAIIIGAIVLLILIWYISVLNGLRRAAVKIKEAESGIDVALTKRFDVLTKMLDVTKAYAEHERTTIMETIHLRKGMSMSERNDVNQRMNEAMGSINAVAEQYPQLRSNENFKQLQISITDVEEHLQAARRLYNGNVSSYNQSIVSFPQSIVAGMASMSQKEFFEADAGKRSDVEMKF